MAQDDYAPVVERMRLADGTLWPIPVTLDVGRAFARELRPGDAVGLRDPEGFLIATMTVGSIFEPDRRREARAVFGTTDETHPGVDHLLNRTHPVYLGGRLQGLAPADRVRLPGSCATSPPICGASSSNGAGRGWSPSRPATRCTARTRS